MGIVQSKTLQNLVVLMEPIEDAWVTPWKGGNIILNRFCIDEDAAFELSRVNFLRKSSEDIMLMETREFQLKRKEKGMEFSIRRSHSIFINLLYINN